MSPQGLCFSGMTLSESEMTYASSQQRFDVIDILGGGYSIRIKGRFLCEGCSYGMAGSIRLNILLIMVQGS